MLPEILEDPDYVVQRSCDLLIILHFAMLRPGRYQIIIRFFNLAFDTVRFVSAVQELANGHAKSFNLGGISMRWSDCT
jgi:hypothetical protein